MPLRAESPNAIKCHLSWRKKSLRSPKAPQIFLVDQVILLAAEAWEGCVCATWKWLAYIVTTLGYNLENIYLRSRIAQNYIFVHSQINFIRLNICSCLCFRCLRWSRWVWSTAVVCRPKFPLGCATVNLLPIWYEVRI